MKLSSFLFFICLSQIVTCQTISFETTIDYYFVDQFICENEYTRDTIKLNGLSEISKGSLETIKNDEYLTQVNECQGLQDIILRNLINGKIKAYDIRSGKQLDSLEIDKIFYVDVYDYSSETLHVVNVEGMHLFQISQKWEISNNYKIQCKILSIDLLKIDEAQNKIGIVRMKFDNDFVSSPIINREEITYITKVVNKVSPQILDKNQYISDHFQNLEVTKYNCNNGATKVCNPIDQKLAKELLLTVDGYGLFQYFYFDNQSYSINSQYISINSFQQEYDENGNFLYFETNLWLKN